MANDMAKPAKTDATTRQQMRRDNFKANVLGQSEHNIPVFDMTCAKYAKYAAWTRVNGNVTLKVRWMQSQSSPFEAHQMEINVPAT